MRSIKFKFLLVWVFVFGFFAVGAPRTQAAGTLSPISGSNNQAQINAALKSGGTVHLNAGAYTISDTIVLNSGNILEGATGARIVLVGQANWPKNKNMIEGLSVSNVRITGFEVDGNRAANETSNGADTSCGLYYYTMIYFKGSSGIEIDNMYLHHNWNDILKFSASSNVKFHHNTVRQPGHDVVYAISSTDVWVYNNYIRIYCNSGIRPDGTKNIYIYNNDIARDEGAGGYAGIEIQGASTVFICNNNIHDTKGGSVVDLSGGSATITYSGCPSSGTSGSASSGSGGTAIGSSGALTGSSSSGTGSTGGTTTTTTDSAGNITTTTTDTSGKVTSTTTDSSGNVTATGTGATTTDSSGSKVTTTTDSAGNTTTTTTDSAGKVTSTTTDSSGNVISTGTGTTTTDTAGNNITTTTDSGGNTTTTTTTTSGSVASTTTDSSGAVTATSTGTALTGTTGTDSSYGESVLGDAGWTGSIDNNVDGNDIFTFFDPDYAVTATNSSSATASALAPAEQALQDLFVALGKSAPTATSTCSSEKSSVGFIPCGKNTDDPDTAWNECDACDLCAMVLMGQLSITFLIKVAATAATLAVLFAGYVYVFAVGKSDLIGLAKKMMVHALIGFLIIFLAWAIVDSLLTTLGYIDPMGDSWYTIC